MFSVRAGFLSGIYPISGFDMPVFLYEDYTYDPEDPEEGLFRGAFLVCVSPFYLLYCHVLTPVLSIGTYRHTFRLECRRNEACQTR